MGTIAEEGRHIYHRNNNGLEDSEDYASFYGRQFERYYYRNFGNNDVAFITERLKYTKEQLGNDWENEAFEIAGIFSTASWGISPKIRGSLVIIRNPYKKTLEFYLRGEASVGAVGTFAGAEVKVSVSYYPGVISIDEFKKTDKYKQYDSWIINELFEGGLRAFGIGLNSASLYAKKGKGYRYAGVGFDAGYNFEFASVGNLIDKIKIGNKKIGTMMAQEVTYQINKFLEDKTEIVNVAGYKQLGNTIKDPFSFFPSPSKMWRSKFEE